MPPRIVSVVSLRVALAEKAVVLLQGIVEGGRFVIVGIVVDFMVVELKHGGRGAREARERVVGNELPVGCERRR